MIMNTNHVVDLISSRSSTQSASQYLTIFRDGIPLNRNLNCKVFRKY
jgi:hypothetical protein